MGRSNELIKKAFQTFREEGFLSTAEKVKKYSVAKRSRAALATQSYEPFMDVLFINGCDPVAAPHPPRYRVAHQKEQLIANNIVSNEVYYTNLSMDQVRNYRMFIFFRCPYTPLIGEFIKKAKQLHKAVLFDIDDLVIDTEYTDQIPYVQSLSGDAKKVYDDGVIRMGKTLSMCDAAITTTERLAEELEKYVPEVFINRNTASERMLRLSEDVLKKRAESAERKHEKKDDKIDYDTGKIRIGYFSGSITHNADFEMILPAIVRILKENPSVELHVVGELDIPDQLKENEKQIVKRGFVNWEKLPDLIGSVDINLAPIEVNIFNEAKSENKWVEAALVKVPTVASNFGAFRRMIEQGRTGLLCDEVDDWYKAIKKLIDSEAERKKIAENAYEYCRKNCTTLYTGFSLAKYIRSKMSPNIAFVLPSLEISGGIMVALKHASFLYDEGFDVTIISEVPGNGWMRYCNYCFPVISKNHHQIFARIDKAVATMWTTVQFLEIYPNVGQRYYLVQNFETDFYTPEVFLRIQANQSYSPTQPVKFITISKWCQEWLAEKYERSAEYAPNGIDSKCFHPKKRDLNQRKIRILIEGDCAAYYKNIDESFRIVDQLNPDKYEVWYMSYNAEPKKNYRVDRFLHRVAYEKAFEVYVQCDILLKSSFLESFSYPPLEMMATGGYAVVVPNDGNAEYLVDQVNCLLYPKGNIDAAVQAITRICEDEELQDTLYENGVRTAQERDWENTRERILRLYDL